MRLADAVGNLFRTPALDDRTYAPGGQLRQAGGTRYRYDEEGNLVRKTTADGKAWHYEWNGAGQLARVQRPDGYAVAFAYDALGRRVSKRYRGRVTRWVWDGDVPLHEWSELEVGPGAGGADDVITWLFEEHSFAPAAKLTAHGSYSVVCDHLGTPLELYDQAGTKTWQAQLDCYGAVRQGLGRAQDCPFRYQGQYKDVETGLYYNRFRYYDPEAGQYISQDPIRLSGGRALYSYVNDPNTWVDILGLAGCPLKATNKTIEEARTGKVRETKGYHGRLGRPKEIEILSNPDAVYHSNGSGGRLIFRKGGDVVITEGPGSSRGQIVTSYGPSGPQGKSGASIFGGQPTEPGLPVSHEQIVGGQVPAPNGGFLAPATQIIP
ncbi:hypothetical protein GCM10022409_09110 [Hymenobacter glaciei]|uniref:Teneurin-like YD-shell domain-containing protein n=1 Tax=Hymenobacter glaciei TaxID=877209 RepID=A0ABP7TLF7_9BACT